MPYYDHLQPLEDTRDSFQVWPDVAAQGMRKEISSPFHQDLAA